MSHLELVALVVREYQPAIDFFVKVLQFELVEDVPSLALLILAIALIAANWFILLSGAVVFLLLAVRSQTEEALLLACFGDAYRSYRESTGRFVPKLRRTIGP